jgi:hypothetical protein
LLLIRWRGTGRFRNDEPVLWGLFHEKQRLRRREYLRRSLRLRLFHEENQAIRILLDCRLVRFAADVQESRLQNQKQSDQQVEYDREEKPFLPKTNGNDSFYTA